MKTQGDIFQKIIEDVCAASKNDFEENGVEPQALNELQQVGHILLLSSSTTSRDDRRREYFLSPCQYRWFKTFSFCPVWAAHAQVMLSVVCWHTACCWQGAVGPVQRGRRRQRGLKDLRLLGGCALLLSSVSRHTWSLLFFHGLSGAILYRARLSHDLALRVHVLLTLEDRH